MLRTEDILFIVLSHGSFSPRQRASVLHKAIKFLINIECWHFFESEQDFIEHSKKTEKWVSIRSHAFGRNAPSETCLNEVGLFGLRLHCKHGAQTTAFSVVIVNRYLSNPWPALCCLPPPTHFCFSTCKDVFEKSCGWPTKSTKSDPSGSKKEKIQVIDRD